MGGHALRDLDPDGSDLSVAQPDARIALQPSGKDFKIGQHVDQAPLEVAQVPADVGLRSEIEDRIADQLARAVIGDITAAVDVEAGDTARLHLRLAEKDVVAGAASADGVGVRVLEQDERVRHDPGAPAAGQPILQRPGLLVWNQSEPADVHVSQRRRGPVPDWPRGTSCAPVARIPHDGSRA